MINMILRELFGISIGICNGKLGLHSWAIDCSDGSLYCCNTGCNKKYDRFIRIGKDKSHIKNEGK